MGGKTNDRRAHPRHDVFAGNAEITKVIGRGHRPKGRARIVNWSRGGVLLRVPSPRRRFVFFSQKPAVQMHDAVACTLRIPPAYNDIEVHASVVRAERVANEPDVLEVGLRFDVTAAEAERRIDSMAKLLEPKHLTSYSQRLPKASGRQKSQRAAVPKSAESMPVAKTSERVVKSTSQRAKPKTSERTAAPKTSQRLEKKASQRLEKKASQRVEKAASQRAPKGASQRLAKQ